ncbi:MAG: hypothetical protein IKP70_13025 [Treponema sp.]|nr:hypothetical protein [Treponema sp.]MBR4323334.1 hypothetical protein [Treponema sp.]
MKKLLFTSAAFFASAFLFAAPAQLTVKSGEKPVTAGWADMGSLSYASKNVIVIDDSTYSSPEAKRKAFTNAIASGSVSSSSINDKAALILVYGTVDLSDGKVSDKDHSYFDEFDSATHKRKHGDFMYDIGSNKTIIGARAAKVAYGGLRIKARDGVLKNVIIQNISFWDAHGSTEYDTKVPEYSSKKASADQLVIEGTEDKSTKARYIHIPENIWIDHCSFSDGVCVDLDRNFNHDGALDIKCGKNVTVSFCEFTNHDKVTLSGSSDKFITRTKEKSLSMTTTTMAAFSECQEPEADTSIFTTMFSTKLERKTIPGQALDRELEHSSSLRTTISENMRATFSVPVTTQSQEHLLSIKSM